MSRKGTTDYYNLRQVLTPALLESYTTVASTVSLIPPVYTRTFSLAFDCASDVLASLQGLYTYYRIVRVVMRITPQIGKYKLDVNYPFSTYSGSLLQETPLMSRVSHVAADFDEDDNAGEYTFDWNDPRVKRHPFYSRSSVSFVPSSEQITAETAFQSAYSPAFKKWYSALKDANVPHYGIVMRCDTRAIIGLTAPDNRFCQRFTIQPIIYFQFKGRRGTLLGG